MTEDIPTPETDAMESGGHAHYMALDGMRKQEVRAIIAERKLAIAREALDDLIIEVDSFTGPVVIARATQALEQTK